MVTICSVLGMLGICSIEDIRKKRNTKRKSIVFWHWWDFTASLAEKSVIIQHVRRDCRRGSSYYSVTGVWWNYWNWRWTGTLCSGNLH